MCDIAYWDRARVKVRNLIQLLGLITRSQAEELLDEKEVHSFLIRLSDKVWGYTISYRCEERIKHFLIDACHFKKVKFDGNSEKLHKDLHALISFHEVSFHRIERQSLNSKMIKLFRPTQ